jgi:chemotaxis protein MotB
MPPPRPIIIIKKKVSHGGHHGGAWKVAYADFVTAMMALFIVLWLLNQSPKIQAAVGGYFRDPNGTASKPASDKPGVSDRFVLAPGAMERLKQGLEKSLKSMPNFDKLKDHIEMTVTSEGLRIDLLESSDGTFFDSGSPKLNADGQDMLIKLAQELGNLPNAICIEGHTDAKPYGGGSAYTNWELSADRANSARRVMQGNGLRADQISQVRGFADQMLRRPQVPLDPANRRISVIVQYVTPVKPDTPSILAPAANPPPAPSKPRSP